METSLIALIVTLLIGVLSAVFGVKKYKIASEKFGQAIELITTIQDAVADKKITNEEVVEIIEKGKALLEIT